jgi:hypothetical protein
MQVEEVDGKNEEVRREGRSIQATLVGSWLQLASKVWMCSRGFFAVQCVGKETRATKWVYCRGIGWVVWWLLPWRPLRFAQLSLSAKPG